MTLLQTGDTEINDYKHNLEGEQDSFPSSLFPSLLLSPTSRHDSEVDSGTGSVCEEDIEEVGEQEKATFKKLIQPDLVAMNQLLNFDEDDEDSVTDSDEEQTKEINLDTNNLEDPDLLEDRKCFSSSFGQTLNLTLDEVKHIRTALIKAELESLPTLISQGKICFSCQKTKFGLFWRGQPCTLCSMLLCSSCVNKIRIPLEQFSAVPVTALCPASYPTILSFPPSTDFASSLSHCPVSKKELPSLKTCSSPCSPDTTRRCSPPSLPYLNTLSGTLQSSSPQNFSPSKHCSLTIQNRTKYNTLPRRRWSMTGSKMSVEGNGRMEGKLLSLCQECNGMVTQVLQSSISTNQHNTSCINTSPQTSIEDKY